MLKKQRINILISTESDIFRADDALPSFLWMRYFIEVQGFTVNESVVYQDNFSVIILEKMGASQAPRVKNTFGCGIF